MVFGSLSWIVSSLVAASLDFGVATGRPSSTLVRSRHGAGLPGRKYTFRSVQLYVASDAQSGDHSADQLSEAEASASTVPDSFSQQHLESPARV